MKKNIIIIANSGTDSNNMSGGDRFFIEFAREWNKHVNVCILACPELKEICTNEYLQCKLENISNISVKTLGLYLTYAIRILNSSFKRPKISKEAIIFSSSDFLPDVMPAFLYRLFSRKRKWIAALHLLTPNPFCKENSLNVRTFFYFITQQLSIFLMKSFADRICIVNDIDRKILLNKYNIAKTKIIKIRPGVTIPDIPQQKKKYDACFVGRFHKQKGIHDLLDIWKRVCQKSSVAKLALIGSGEQEWFDFIENYINEHKLDNNIDVLGFKDGEEKFKIMKSSKVFLFPSNYESFGIAGLEALASGLPVVAYDIPIFKEIFHDTFQLVPFSDNKAFANEVIKLLNDNKYYIQKQEQGLKFTQNFTWGKAAKELFDKITNSLYV